MKCEGRMHRYEHLKGVSQLMKENAVPASEGNLVKSTERVEKETAPSVLTETSLREKSNSTDAVTNEKVSKKRQKRKAEPKTVQVKKKVSHHHLHFISLLYTLLKRPKTHIFEFFWIEINELRRAWFAENVSFGILSPSSGLSPATPRELVQPVYGYPTKLHPKSESLLGNIIPNCSINLLNYSANSTNWTYNPGFIYPKLISSAKVLVPAPIFYTVYASTKVEIING